MLSSHDASSAGRSRGQRVFVAGHQGLVGSAVVRALLTAGDDEIITRERSDLDLGDASATRAFLLTERPDVVVLAAAKVGGIRANWEQPWDFIYENLVIEANVIGAAFSAGVRRLIFLGSSCIYPRDAEQPIREEALLTGPLEVTNQPYAVAKIAGIELCRSLNRQHGTDYLSLMPTNLYGPGDNFDLTTSHVMPAMMRKFHEAKLAGHLPVVLWGTGAPRREFLHVDDLGRAVVFCLQNVAASATVNGILNVGFGSDLLIAELATLVQRVVGHQGKIEWDASQPDGTPRKLMDSSRLQALGWRPSIGLEQGLRETYEWYLQTAQLRGESH